MGNYLSKQQQLQYYSDYEDTIYGKGTLYSSTKLSNAYIFKTIKLVENTNIYELYSQIEDKQNIYLLALYGYVFGKSCECNAENVVEKCAVIYWEFLSFSLRECVNYRQRVMMPFNQSQIWHIIKAAVYGYTAFQRTNTFYEFYIDNIFINMDGRARLNWMHIQPRNEHLRFIKKAKQYRNNFPNDNHQFPHKQIHKQMQNYDIYQWDKISQQRSYFSPQELYSIFNLEFTNRINFAQANIFSLGMMILHLCILRHPFEEFYRNKCIDYGRINYVMFYELQRRYSRPLLALIGSMLNQNPFKRPNFQDIRRDYGDYMRSQYEIMIAVTIDNKIERSKKNN